MNIRQYPKVELHLHLDSSLSYDVAQQINPSLSRQEFQNSFIAPEKCADLPDYLTRVARQVEILQTKKALKLATKGLLQELKEDNILYSEIRFAPLLHTKNGLNPEEVVEIVNDTIEASLSTSNMDVNIILCNVRHFPETESIRTAQIVNKFKGSHVVGLDLAGDEKGFPLKNHIKAYNYAREKNIPRTAHAGEACGPESVWETIETLNPTRIGHGVRSFDDPELLDYLSEKNIHLEVCPTSNIQTDVYDTYTDHTISKLYEKNISLSINTDGRTTSNVSLTDEYKKLNHIFGWAKENFLQCNLNALNAAFISEAKRRHLKKIITAGYE